MLAVKLYVGSVLDFAHYSPMERQGKIDVNVGTRKESRKGFCRNPRGIFPKRFPGEFYVGFLVDFLEIASLEKNTGGKIRPNGRLICYHYWC